MDTTLVDPHYPKTIDDMAGAKTWQNLALMIKSPTPPHILLVGSAGSGKSCAIRLCIPSNQIGLWFLCTKDTTLRSESRDRIKSIARRRTQIDTVQWIVLEHADALHADAQAFLRRIIETSVGSTRFLLEVRDSAAVAEPIVSRTVMFTAPKLLDFEIRAEIIRRCPHISLETATMLAQQCDENVRYAICQALGNIQSSSSLPQPLSLSLSLSLSQPQPLSQSQPLSQPQPNTWSDLYSLMKTIQDSGDNPQMFVSKLAKREWDRPGGACPWAILALHYSAFIQ